MKQHLKFLVILFAVATAGCTKEVTQEEYDRMESDYQEQISDLEAKVQAQKEYIKETSDSIHEVSNDVDRFQYEDWRQVVPDVYKKVKDLDSKITSDPIDGQSY